MYLLNLYNDNEYFNESQDEYGDTPINEHDPVALFSNTPSHFWPEYHLQGPISAPAVTQSSDDYFSLPFSQESAPAAKYAEVEFVDNHPNSVQTRQNTESYHRLQLPENARQKRRTYSTNRIRNRSNLSHSFTHDGGQTNIFDEELNRQPIADSASNSNNERSRKAEKPKKGEKSKFGETLKLKDNKPAFRLDLGMFNPPMSPLHKVKKGLHGFPSPQSDSGVFRTTSRVESFGSDVLLQHGHDGEVDHLLENVTPLLVPLPAEHDYFGDYNNSDHSTGYNDAGLLGGYINVSGRVFENPTDKPSKNYVKFHEENAFSTADYEGFRSDLGRSVSHESEAHRTQGAHSSSSGYGEIRPYATENIHESHFNENYGPGIHYNHENRSNSHERHNEDMHQFNYNQLHNNPDLGKQYNRSHQEDLRHHQDLSHHQPNLHQGAENYHQDNKYHDQDKQRHFVGNDNFLDSNYQDRAYSDSMDMSQTHYKQNLANGGVADSFNQFQRLPSNYAIDERAVEWEVPHHLRASITDDGGDSLNGVDEPKVYYINEAHSDNPPEANAEEVHPGKEQKRRKGLKVTICPVCGKHITRDYSRHIRIHDEAGRFQCIFPAGYCKHKSGKFNRPYDYKKHLLNVHFEFDDPTIKLAHTLAGKMDFEGKCSVCHQKFVGSEWLKKHILTEDMNDLCLELQRIRRNHQGEYTPVTGVEDTKLQQYAKLEEEGF